MNAKDIKYSDLRNANGGVIINNGRFWKINGIDGDVFHARSERDTWQGKVKFLHPHGKGIIKQYDGMKPFFMYKEVPRKDTPKDILNGTDFDKIDTSTIQGVRNANLTNHIVQDGDSKQGGFVTHDYGGRIEVKMKDGSIKNFDKDHLHLVKIHYTKKYHKRLWFRYDVTKSLPHRRNNDLKLSPKGAYDKYMELKKSLDPHYERSDDFRVYRQQSQLRDEMNKLWSLMTPQLRKKAAK